MYELPSNLVQKNYSQQYSHGRQLSDQWYPVPAEVLCETLLHHFLVSVHKCLRKLTHTVSQHRTPAVPPAEVLRDIVTPFLGECAQVFEEANTHCESTPNTSGTAG